MCLVTEQKKPIKLKEDMTVYKILGIRDRGYSGFNFEFDYRLGCVHETEMRFDNNSNTIWDSAVEYTYKDWENGEYTHVHNAFHSATEERKRALLMTMKSNKALSFDDFVLSKCTIPKGSLIFKDKTGLIASNQIIIDEIL
jgi:hypothetical protein